MGKSLEGICKVIYEELNKESVGYGEKYHSVAEAYTTIKVAVEDAQDEMKSLTDHLIKFWEEVSVSYDTVEEPARIRYRTLVVMLYLIRVAMTAEKAMRGYEIEAWTLPWKLPVNQ